MHKLTKDDKLLLHRISRNKGYDLGAHLLEHEVDRDTFDYIMQGSDSVNYESNKQRQEWLAGAMRRMEERLPPERVKEIREGCACCLGGQRAEIAKHVHDAYPTVAERFDAFSKARTIVGDTAYRVGENVYRVCFWETPPEKNGCSCLKYTPKTEPMPMSWCLCCGGHIKSHFEHALGVKADCRCVSSQLTSCGKEPCVFELTVTGVEP